MLFQNVIFLQFNANNKKSMTNYVIIKKFSRLFKHYNSIFCKVNTTILQLQTAFYIPIHHGPPYSLSRCTIYSIISEIMQICKRAPVANVSRSTLMYIP